MMTNCSFSESNSSAEDSSWRDTKENLSLIMHPEISHFLPNIANQLDLLSFANLASTSKDTKRILDTSPRIKIPLDANALTMESDRGGRVFMQDITNKKASPLCDEAINKIKRLPVELHVFQLIIGTQMDRDAFENVEKYLTSLKIKTVNRIFAQIADWNSVIDFAWKYRLEGIVDTNSFDVPHSLSDETVNSLQSLQLKTGEYSGYISNDSILSWTCPSLLLDGCDISPSTCKGIIKQWLEGDREIFDLSFATQMTREAFDKLFTDFVHVERKGVCPSTRPFVVCQALRRRYWIVKEDNTWLRICITGGTIIIDHRDYFLKYHSAKKVPVVLRSL